MTSRGSRRDLRHPAHEELGIRFTESLAGALVYDFEEVGLEACGIFQARRWPAVP